MIMVECWKGEKEKRLSTSGFQTQDLQNCGLPSKGAMDFQVITQVCFDLSSGHSSGLYLQLQLSNASQALHKAVFFSG